MEAVEEEKMPLREYKWIHGNAKLSIEEQEAVIAWARQSRVLYQLGARPR